MYIIYFFLINSKNLFHKIIMRNSVRKLRNSIGFFYSINQLFNTSRLLCSRLPVVRLLPAFDFHPASISILYRFCTTIDDTNISISDQTTDDRSIDGIGAQLTQFIDLGLLFVLITYRLLLIPLPVQSISLK